jgi:TonB family protein
VPTDPYLEDPPITANRRVHSRQKLHSVAYIDLGPSNGGVVLNLSESGLALSTAMKLIGDELPNMRFRLPGLDEVIESSARIVWMSESKKEAGVQFEQLLKRDAQKISEWISAEQGFKARLEAEVSGDVAMLTAEAPSADPVSTEWLEPTFADRAGPPESADLEQKQEREFNVAPSNRTSAAHDFISAPLGEIGALGSPGNIDIRRSKPESNQKWGIPSAIIAAIAIISFSTGLLIERRIQRVPASPVSPMSAAETNGADERTAASSTIEKAGSQGEKQDALRGPANDNSEPSPGKGNVARSEPQTMPSDRDKVQQGRGSKASERTYSQDGASRPETARSQTPRRDGAPKSDPSFPTKTGIAPPRGSTSLSNAASLQVAEQKSTEATAPDSAKVQPESVGASTPRQVPTTRQVSASENSAPPSFAPAPPKSLMPSIAVRMPPFPSMRIPPQLKSQTSRTGTSLQIGQLMSRIEPTYPAEAVRQEIAGTVKVHAAIGRDGAVQSVEANGPAMLAEAAMKAVREWRYKPTLLDGQAVEADEEIVFVFRLAPINH